MVMQYHNKLHTYQKERGERDVEISSREGGYKEVKDEEGRRIHLGYFGGSYCQKASSNSLVLILLFGILFVETYN